MRKTGCSPTGVFVRLQGGRFAAGEDLPGWHHELRIRLLRQPAHVTLPNGTNIDYVIDGQNRRIGKKVNGALVEGLIYRNQLQPSVWLNGDGSVRAAFVYGLSANVPEYVLQGGTTYRLITDQVGTVRLVVNTSTGIVAERIDYDEFGNVLSDSAAGFQPFGFAGGLRDSHSALTRYGARDYDQNR